jgi:hypothetical protein
MASKEIVIPAANALTLAEVDELKEHEYVINEGLHHFLKVGEALTQIRDKRLYRAKFASFEAYCQERWNMGRQYAYRLIGGAEVAGNLVSSIGDTGLPQREAHTRELAKLAPEAQSIAWLKAVEKAGSVEAVTADHVHRAVNEVLGKAGRFETKLYYAYDEKRRVIYDDGSEQYDGRDKPVLRSLYWKKGGDLNSMKEYDGYQLVPVPTLDVPPITDRLPGINVNASRWGDGKCYPVNRRKEIIYNDPVPREERGEKRYPNCEFVTEGQLVYEWGTLRDRLFEFTIRPPDPCVEWTDKAHFQPGKFIRCYSCGTVHPYAEMVAGVHGEFWTCPKGHVIRDERYIVRDEAPTEPAKLPSTSPTKPVPEPPKQDAPTTPPPTDDSDDDGEDALMGEMGEVYAAVVQLDEFLTTLRDNIDDFNELLNLRTDILEEFRNADEYVEDETLDLARKLLAVAQGVPNAEV